MKGFTEALLEEHPEIVTELDAMARKRPRLAEPDAPGAVEPPEDLRERLRAIGYLDEAP